MMRRRDSVFSPSVGVMFRSSLVLCCLLHGSKAWLPQSATIKPKTSHSFSNRRVMMSAADPILEKDFHEFDFLLREGPEAQEALAASSVPHRRRVMVQLGGDNGDNQKSLLMSSVAAPATEGEQSATTESTEASQEYDPYADLEGDIDARASRVQQIQEQKPTFETRLKEMDLQDIIITLVVPGIVSFAGIRWGFNKVSGRVAENADTTLSKFAEEMVYHDGDLEEMRMCYADYSRQLLWMGPKKGDAMIKRYLQLYAKRKTVSPKSIATLSYVFTLFKLSEEKAAQVLVALCREMGTDKISSAGKILFFGSRILRSEEGKQGLEPIKDLIKSTYRDATVAETLVETSQQAIGEAAYRTAVLAGGKKQKKLTTGWEVLGLDKETATRIFEEEAKEGFVSDVATMYGGQTTKYDKKGRRLDEEGELANPEEAADDDDDDDEAGPVSNVYECTECGYTLFVAKGREFKFFGDDFECPECGAKKDKFEPKDIEE